MDDSKRLTPGERAEIFAEIEGRAMSVAVGVVDARTIDRVNILEATRLAMRQALGALGVSPDLVLTDWVALAGLPCPQKNLVRGDQRSATVAAASIVAKVTRDRIMDEADREFPQYGFGRHKGYPTEEHRLTLAKHGPCPQHRRCFHGVLPIDAGSDRRVGGMRGKARAWWTQADLFGEGQGASHEA